MEKNKKKLTNSYLGGGLLKNKAFTLIELLAIIVILAIIAVITVPIILNVIDNAKRGSVIDSAYGYKDAVDKYYITKLMEEDFELDDTYSVSDGKLGGIDIPISGMKPISGTLTYEDNDLKSGCLTFDDYKVTYDGSKFTSELGICPTQNSTQRAINYTDSNGVKYYNTEWIGANPVYYDPVTGTKCDDYHEDNSKTGYNGITTDSLTDNNTANNNGCLKWYAYSENTDGTVNLLLDHNTTAQVAWVSLEDYGNGIPELSTILGITYPSGSIVGSDTYGSNGNWNKGPITLLNQLKIDTNEWSGILNRTDSYINKNNYNNSGTVTERYAINYSSYKARLMTAGEISNIVGFDSFDEKTSINFLYFDSQTSSSSPTCTEGNTIGCSYGWLYDRTGKSCIKNGCLSNSDANAQGTWGYWTYSSSASGSNSAWRVNNLGSLRNSSGLDILSYSGVRPVISILKSDLSLG